MNREAFVKSFFEKVKVAGDNAPLPLLTLEEFFNGNTDEYSIAPNQFFDEGYAAKLVIDYAKWGEEFHNRPTLAEMWERLSEIEKRADVAWVLVELHGDTKDDGVITGESILICSSASADELEKALNVEWFCTDSDWFCECDIAEDNTLLDGSFVVIPEGYRIFAMQWD